MGSDPFYVAFGSTGIKDTLSNLCEVPEFVVNIVTMHLLEQMNFTSGNSPRDEDEYQWAGLTPMPSAKVRPPRVAEAKEALARQLRATGWSQCERRQPLHTLRSLIALRRRMRVTGVWLRGPQHKVYKIKCAK
jgi:hypothetical protein